MKKIAVIGAHGQLGRDLCSRLPGEVHALTRAELNLAEPMTLDVLKDIGPQIVINCAAYNLVDKAEDEPEVAAATNSWGTLHLARQCQAIDATLIHFSTDYVYGLETSRSVPWEENDAPGPVSVYGLTKLAGEYAIRATMTKHFILRTCGLYGVWGSGGKGTNFVETMLRLASQDKPLRIVNDQYCTPTYTADLANAVIALLDNRNYGLYHLTNSGSCTWFDFANEIFFQAGMAPSVTPITSEEFGARARRPKYSVLSNQKWYRQGLAEMRRWQEALSAYLTERQERQATQEKSQE